MNQMIQSTNMFVRRTQHFLTISYLNNFLSPSSVSNRKLHLLQRIQDYGKKTAISANHLSTSYEELLYGSLNLSKQLSRGKDVKEERFAFITERDHTYPMIQWGIWLSGGIAVPLHTSHPDREIEYVLTDCDVKKIIIHSNYMKKMKPIIEKLNLQYHIIETQDLSSENLSKDDGLINPHHFSNDRRAQILYTSGTTGRPKGVVTTHGSLMHQIKDVVQSWEISSMDRILHFLPLHHTHGIVNKLLCIMYAGGTCEFLGSANTKSILDRLAANHQSHISPPLTLFMAVPTIYMKIMEELAAYDSKKRNRIIQAFQQMRVCISGSMACPINIIEKWKELTGHILLERYGMTELNMVLTNPLHGTRHIGYVGKPFPSVQVRIVDLKTDIEVGSDLEGELRVKGPTVFQEYWNRITETKDSFDDDGWFKTGDISMYNSSLESYCIRGRASVDIIKSGGYKISALDIEAVINAHPKIAESYVFGIEDMKWGEIICTLVRPEEEIESKKKMKELTSSLHHHLQTHLASYKIPKRMKFLNEIPKNAMGKVNKKELRSYFQEGEDKK